MCTVVILRRPGHDWHLILGANRDEKLSRPWQPPARHWPDRSDVVAPLDEVGGGTWMGVNETGVLACILNGRNTLGPQAGKRSRGEIVLEALDHEDAVSAAEALVHLDGRSFRDFNLVIADNRDAYWLRLDSSEPDTIQVHDIPAGLFMLTAEHLNDPKSARIRRYLPQFESAAAPDPDAGIWTPWSDLMAAKSEDGAPATSMCFRTETGEGTSSSGLFALPSVERAHSAPPTQLKWMFSEGPPDQVPFAAVSL